MTSFLKRARIVHDVESDLEYVAIEYTKYTPENGYADFIDYLQTTGLGDWTELVSKKQSIRYENFLDSMVEPTFETKCKMATIALENILCDDNDPRTWVRLMHTAKILDPTFIPPYINMNASWQVKFAEEFCKQTLPDLIERTLNIRRLTKLFNVLKIIEQR